jgi:hypothetical protein
MEQENAQARLAGGLKLERGDLDCYNYAGRTLCQRL